ncbi:MAG: hypothetical protein FWE88_06275 [Phycisphaerae bacterium]|nr:hypothetical protein [Phycisphaerae bacterium]
MACDRLNVIVTTVLAVLLLTGCAETVPTSTTVETPSGAATTTDVSPTPGVTPQRNDNGSTAPSLVGMWTAEGDRVDESVFPSGIELNSDATAKFITGHGVVPEQGERLTWKTQNGRLTFTIVRPKGENEESNTAAVTFDYTLSDSMLTLANAQTVIVIDGEEARAAHEGSTTYKKRDPAAIAPETSENNNVNDDIPDESAAFVGVWVAEGEIDTQAFLRSFELRSDGTVIPDANNAPKVPEEFNITWEIGSGCLTIRVVHTKGENESPDITTVTYDYTLSDSTLFLTNARGVRIDDGETENHKSDGSATYKRKE